MGAGLLGGRFNFRPGGVGLPISDILRYGTAKEIDVLLYDADGAAQAGQGDGADILPVDENLPAGHIIETGDKIAQRGLSAAGRAHQS